MAQVLAPHLDSTIRTTLLAMHWLAGEMVDVEAVLERGREGGKVKAGSSDAA